ncbi:MAG: EAL domain-containing protein [Gammaproteobacteria bacterium]|nr:EAL domain-containing protein [Gammaproteobacteria bacterium]
MERKNLPFHPKLPARIAGIVFWVLALVSLIVAIYYLNKVDAEISVSRQSGAYLIAHEIEDKVNDVSDPERLKEVINSSLGRLNNVVDFSSAIVRWHDIEILYGSVHEQDDKYEHLVVYGADIERYIDHINVEIYFPNKELTVAAIRKNMLLAIGIGILIFGLFLRQVLHMVLTRPFASMLESAKSFTLGDESIRFNDTRQDEFGYLGRFINHAIESVLDHQEDLIKALKRASRSEAELNLEKEFAEVTLHSIADSVVTVDTDSKIKFVNPAAEELIGMTVEELMDRYFYDVLNIVDERSGNIKYDPIGACFETGNIVNFPEQSSLVNKASVIVAVEATVAPMKNDQGDLLGAVVVMQDVSHTRKLTHQLSYQASHDPLTGLYNRRKFEAYLKEALEEVAFENRRHVFLYLDLDQFKIVNDTCGHIAGDELLQQLPLLFHKVLRTGDVVARLGGDEFGVLLENCSLNKAIVIAEMLREQIKEFRFVWEDKTFEIGVSIGAVEINAENTSITNIFSSADIACYAAKDGGRNRVHVYEESDVAVARRHGEMHWTSRITKAIEEDRFCLYQQNIVNLKSGEIEHVEVLLRMKGEDGEIIVPGAFLPAAERFNLMAAIDRWVISRAFKLIGDRITLQTDVPIDIVAVNLSGDSLNDDDLLEFIYEEKNKYNVSLDRICFEITETIAISNLSKATAFIEELKIHGCKFALDDFGSGLSSFTYLKTLPVHYLKIDGSFVRDIAKDKIDRAMVQSIQQVAEAMNLMTIAEWVEDEATLDILRQMGVDCAQGNYLMPAELIVCKETDLNE